MPNAVELINAQLNVRKILEYYNFNQPTGNKLLRTNCKIHDGGNTTSFVINEENGLWYCHSGCGGGDIFTLAQRLDNINFFESVKRIAGILSINISDAEIIEHKPQYLKDTEKWVKSMRKRKPIIMPYTIPVPTLNVNKFRNFDSATLSKFLLQFVKEIIVKTNDKEYTLYNRLLIPIFFNSIQAGVVLRKTKTADYPKWSNLPPGIETGNILYNYDEAKYHETINIVEGIFDVWAMHEAGMPNTVATFGAHMSDEQEKLLLKTGADIIIAYDGDEAGYKATNAVINKLRLKANLRIANLPNNADPCSLTTEELQKVMQETLKIYEWGRQI